MQRQARQHLHVLYEELCADEEAFGLRASAVAAGERLAVALPRVSRDAVPRAEDLPEDPVERVAVWLVREVGGTGVSLADVAVRRAVVRAVRSLDRRRPEFRVALNRNAQSGEGIGTDLLCLLFQLFFAAVYGEFLHATFAHAINATLGPATPLPEQITDAVSDSLVDAVPDPCAEQKEQAERVERDVAVGEFVVEGDTDPLTELFLGSLPDSLRAVLESVVDEG